jgi:tRNA threonylcarbamoyladenosine modification (KEOPS) complex Cgi121 subunit
MLQSIPEEPEVNDEEIKFEIPLHTVDSKSIVSHTDSAASKSLKSSNEDRQFEVMPSMEWAVRMTILG